jgi:archaetidylinositol phosphate synthase
LVLDAKRERADPFLEPIARRLVRVDPNVVSVVAIVLAFMAEGAFFYSPDSWEYLLPLGAVLVILSGFFDALDGKIARLANKASKKGDFVDHVLDRYADVFMIGDVAISAWCDPTIGILAVVGVLLTSYMGTQAQAIGAGRLYAGLLGRADRVVLLTAVPLLQWAIMFHTSGWFSIGGWTFSLMELMMVYFAVVGNLTAVQRAVTIWKRLGEQDQS